MKYDPRTCIAGLYFKCPTTHVPRQDEITKKETYGSEQLTFDIPANKNEKPSVTDEPTASQKGPSKNYYKKSTVRKITYKVVKK